MTVHKNSAMEENIKMQILANDVVRRLNNTHEALGRSQIARVVDGYGQKLLNSGYKIEQVRAILVRGIRGYEGRKLRCKKEGRKLKSIAMESSLRRRKKKLLSRATWYKKSRKDDLYQRSLESGRGTSKGQNNRRVKTSGQVEPRSVLFVEQTGKEELGSRIRELISRLSPILGFTIKEVKRTGTNLRNKLSQSNLWEGAPCGRADCVPCTQEEEVQIPCSRRSVVYETICKRCNPGAGGKGEEDIKNKEIPSL